MKRLLLLLLLVTTVLSTNAQMHLSHKENQIRLDSNLVIISKDSNDKLIRLKGIDKLGNRVEFFIAKKHDYRCIISILFITWEDVASISKMFNAMYGNTGGFRWVSKNSPLIFELNQDSTDVTPWVVGYIDPRVLRPVK